MGKTVSIDEFSNYNLTHRPKKVIVSSQNNIEAPFNYCFYFNEILVLDSGNIVLASKDSYIEIAGVETVSIDESILPFAIIYNISSMLNGDIKEISLVVFI